MQLTLKEEENKQLQSAEFESKKDEKLLSELLAELEALRQRTTFAQKSSNAEDQIEKTYSTIQTTLTRKKAEMISELRVFSESKSQGLHCSKNKKN